MNRRTPITSIFAFAVLLCLAPPVVAEDVWPSRVVKIVVPFPAGGPTDVYARMAGDILQRRLGLQIVVENKPGAGGNIAAAEVVKAAPDGYTLLVGGPSTHAINQTLYARPGFDSSTDLEQIAIIARAPSIATVHPTVPAATFQDYLALIRREGKEVPYPMPGIGTTPHLAGELLRARYDLPLKAVAYRGAGPALNDAIGGHVLFMLNNVDLALPHVKSGALRGLAVTSRARIPALPDVPTMAEVGIPDMEIEVWHIMAAPKGTPRAIIDKLNRAVLEGMNDPAMVAKLAEQGVSVDQRTPDELKVFVAAERERWSKIVKLSGAKLD